MENISDIEISRKQVKLLDDVHKLLRPLADATRLLEADTYPTLAWVVEIQFLLTKHLRSFSKVALTNSGSLFQRTFGGS